MLIFFLFKGEILCMKFYKLLMYYWYKIVCVFIVFKILIYFGYKFNYKIINKCLVGFILINLIWLSLFVDVCIIILFFFFDVIEDVFD